MHKSSKTKFLIMLVLLVMKSPPKYYLKPALAQAVKFGFSRYQKPTPISIWLPEKGEAGAIHRPCFSHTT
jgi:hypothetical protein